MSSSSTTKIRIERRGGFAGLSAEAVLEVALLTAAQRRALDTVLATAPATSPTGPDRFRYRIHTVAADGHAAVLELAEDAMPAALAALVKPPLP